MNEILNVEVVNSIPDSDLNYIVDLYRADELKSELDILGRGSYGKVYGYKDYAIKYIHDTTEGESNDVEVLKDIGHLKWVPTLYAVINDNILIIERIYGETVDKYCYRNSSNGNPWNVKKDIVNHWEEALNTIMELGYTPEDLHENNVMIDKNTSSIKIVDVGWFKKREYEIEEYDDDVGYSSAQGWTGHALRRYVEDFCREEVAS